MPDLPDIRAGIYRHYRGPLYQVLGYAHDANADYLYDAPRMDAEPMSGRVVVVYVPLQLDGAHLGPRMAVRTAEDFLFEHLHERPVFEPPWRECTADCPQAVGHRPRFRDLGPELTRRMYEGYEPR